MTAATPAPPDNDTVITEQDLIDAIRPTYEFYEGMGNTAKQDLIIGIVFSLADKLKERNGWDLEERKAFARRVLTRE